MQAVHDIGEVGVIDHIRRRMRATPSVRVGIGDDAAVLRTPDGGWLLFASDMLVEGIHFRLGSAAGTEGVTEPALIGWKALACNVSDIAAMGGRPCWAVVSLGLPPNTPLRFVDGVSAGLQRCARRFRMAIVGGDTVRAPQVVIDVAILGVVEPAHLTLRSGARVGDRLFVTGCLGGSLRSGRHARFVPRLREAHTLLRRVRVHAMLDLSDGLASDLWQMSRSSRVRLRVEAAQIPVAAAARDVYHALHDGEDFELLFAVGARQAGRVPRRIGACPVTRIGSVVGRGIGVELQQRDGRITPLIPKGFRHF